MYRPAAHRLDDVPEMWALIDAHPLGHWACPTADGLSGHHIPWRLERPGGAGGLGTLIGHVARANRVWTQLPEQGASLVMFVGPQAYITPGWYPGKQAHGEVVPTWNYVAVHAHGVARAVHQPDAVRALLSRLTDAQEAQQPHPWRLTDAPADYIDRLLRAVVGIEITIERLEGRLKLSQDEAPQDRAGTVQGLRALQQPHTDALAELVARAATDHG